MALTTNEKRTAKTFILLILLAETILILGLIYGTRHKRIAPDVQFIATPDKKESAIVIPTPTLPPDVVLTPITSIVNKPVSNPVKSISTVEIEPIVRTQSYTRPNRVFNPTPLDMLYLQQNTGTNYQSSTIGDNPTLREIQSIKISSEPVQTTMYYHITIK